MDETTLSLEPPLRACWVKIHTQKRVPMPLRGEKQTCHIFGGYNWRKDTITWTTAQNKNSATFIQFLEELFLKQYPTACILLVMDNAGYHKSAAATAALSLFEQRVIPVFLPPYCSNLNPIERFWRFLKEQTHANRLEDSIDALREQAIRVLSRQNDLCSDHRFSVSKYL